MKIIETKIKSVLITLCRLLVLGSIAFWLTGCEYAKIRLTDESISPQPGKDGIYTFKVRAFADNTQSSVVVENSVNVYLILNDGTRVNPINHTGVHWDFKIKDTFQSLYCDKKIKAKFLAEYKRATYFHENQRKTTTLETDVPITPRENIVLDYTYRAYPIKTPNPVKLAWRTADEPRTSFIVIANWSHEKVNININTLSRKIIIHEEEEQNFVLEACGNDQGHNTRLIRVVCKSDDILDPVRFTITAESKTNGIQQFEAFLTCEEFEGA